MDRDRLKNLLRNVASGHVTTEEALDELRLLPFERIDQHINLDHHRELRSGAPEVVLGEWKSASEISRILVALAKRGRGALATRVAPDKAEQVVKDVAGATYHDVARVVMVPPSAAASDSEHRSTRGLVAVVAAGTSDVAVAEEAALTLEFLGHEIDRIYDVGVAGVHRLLSEAERLSRGRVAIVVAGMEGALPSVVASLIDRPVIAVPTSVGYGVSAGGFAALLGMLSSCAPGVTVVNIDNGFGAAVAATRMSQLRDVRSDSKSTDNDGPGGKGQEA
ncbi:MAG: nickel pincer cofactor biosynthesis protein LarB [Proteobacteria bacterium]|nr:nickel pincer cofactor biosynthesis protein LarB [Pseudomonadota bacterium]